MRVIQAFFWASVCIVVIGALCNVTVIAANGWRMPVAVDELPDTCAGFFGQVPVCRVTEGTLFVALADIYELRIAGRDRLFSVGDVFLVTGGAFTLIFGATYFWMLEIAKQAKKMIAIGPSPRRLL